MEDHVQDDIVSQEVQEQEVEQTEQDVQQDHVGQVQPQAQAQESEKDKNFRYLRQQNELLQKERDEYYRVLKNIESNQKQKQTPEEINNLGPDDLVEWKHVQRELNKVKEELNTYKQQSYQYSAESRLKAQYPDFDRVVNDTSIAALREQYPELAQSLNSNPDVYSKASAVYTLVKKLGLSPSDESLLERAKIQENSKKPRPLSSISPQQGETPLSKANAFANGLTNELRAQLLKEMQEAKKKL